MTQNKKTNFQVGDFVKVKNGKKDPDFEESGTLLTNCTNRLIRMGVGPQQHIERRENGIYSIGRNRSTRPHLSIQLIFKEELF
jgi:hypothetical protein